MKTLPAGLQEHLDSGETTMAFCWRVVREDGTVQGFTEHDENITFDSLTYLASSGFTGSKIQSSLGLSIDNLEAKSALDNTTINEDDLAAGRYDNAEVEVYWVNFENVAQRVLVSKGNIGRVKREELAFTAELRSMSHRMNQRVGRVYQKTCDVILGSARCGVNLASFTSTGSVSSVTTNRIFSVSIAANDTDGYYSFGLLEFTSGLNNGLKFEVKSHSQGLINLWEVTPFNVSVSDTFSIIAGCDKYGSTCHSKFNNMINFQGFNRIPGRDNFLKVASRDTNQRGQSLFND